MRMLLSALLAALALGLCAGPRDASPAAPEPPPRQMEYLTRGLVVWQSAPGEIVLSWRVLGTDPESIGFWIERSCGDDAPVRLTETPLTTASHFLDKPPRLDRPLTYRIRPVGTASPEPDSVATLPANPPVRAYRSIPLRTLPGHTPNDASLGDLDGDGNPEIVLKQEMRPRDNAQAGLTGETKLEAYQLDGTFMWRINLGRNIREGAHYTPFLVHDFDGDGEAEVVCRTADGTVDGTGRILGDPRADHRNAEGRVLEGPEFLSVFAGRTGKVLASVPYEPARGQVRDWGDATGNRVDRFLACVAYLDGERPSIVMCRGYYTRSVLVAWDWRDGRLTRRWIFDSDDGTPGNRDYRGQGNHNLAVADLDGDGRDEIIYGSCCIGSDGRGRYSTGLGHGDALHVSDLDPARPGLEIFGIHEKPRHDHGVAMLDARTGKILWSKKSADVARGLAIDIDSRHPGCECWALGDGLRQLWNARGDVIAQRAPRSCNFGVWWDGDRLRELLDRDAIRKWDWLAERETTLLRAEGCAWNNGTKATPCLCADLDGDWREEVIWRSADNQELRVYSTPIPTNVRLPTLLHDPQYRLSVAWQNVGYNQPTQTSFFLGEGMAAPPRPRIRVVQTRAHPNPNSPLPSSRGLP